MKVKVVKTFRDKETGSVLRPNLIMYIKDERVEELTSAPEPFVEVIEEETNFQNDGEIDYIAFVKMSKKDLVKYAKEVMGVELNMEMTKTEMIELLEK